MKRRSTTKGYKRCDGPACRCLVAPGRGVRVKQSGLRRRLRFCDQQCRDHYMEVRRTRACAACGAPFMVPAVTSARTVCDSCSSIEGRFGLNVSAMSRLPGSHHEVDTGCDWCGDAITSEVYHHKLTPDDLAELASAEGVDQARWFCSDPCSTRAHNFHAGLRSTAVRRGAYTGPEDQPLLTIRDACRLRKDTTCSWCGLTDLKQSVLNAGHEDDTWTLDHPIGIAIGGFHAEFNAVPSCWKCNSGRPRDCTDVCRWYTRVSDRKEFGSYANIDEEWPLAA